MKKLILLFLILGIGFLFPPQASATVSPQVAAGSVHTVGLKFDGTVVAVGENVFGQCNVFDWDIQLGFIDVPSGSNHEESIYAIYNAGIATGCSQNPLRFCPQDPVTRAQMAAFIIRALEGEPPSDYCDTGSPFPDVSADSPTCKYIKRFFELGITSGYSDGTYRPGNTVIRRQMAAFLDRAFLQTD